MFPPRALHGLVSGRAAPSTSVSEGCRPCHSSAPKAPRVQWPTATHGSPASVWGAGRPSPGFQCLGASSQTRDWVLPTSSHQFVTSAAWLQCQKYPLRWWECLLKSPVSTAQPPSRHTLLPCHCHHALAAPRPHAVPVRGIQHMSCINLPTLNDLVCGDAHHAAVPNLCYPMLSPKAQEELQFPKHSRNRKRL